MLTVHRRIAILVAVFLLVQAISGIAISWRWDLARIVDPVGMARSQDGVSGSVDIVLSRALASLPVADSLRVFFPQNTKGVYLLRLETRRGSYYASIDPADGAILREGTIWSFPVEAALRLHFQPLSGWPGSLLVLLLGIALISTGVSGFLFWRPAIGRRRGRLAIDLRQPVKQILRQGHRTLGVLFLPLFLVVGATGVALALELLLATADLRLEDPQYDVLELNGLAPILGAAQKAFPGTQVRDLRLSSSGMVLVQLFERESSPWSIHRVTGSIDAPTKLGVRSAADVQGWWPKLLPIHTGSILGVPGKVLATLTASVLAVLALVGLWLWLSRAWH